MSIRRSSQHKSRRQTSLKQERITLWEQRTPKDGFEGKEAAKEDGWIWNIKPGKGMKEAELKAWLEEGELNDTLISVVRQIDIHIRPLGDQIQWFRADAEMWRWLEQTESKHAEFERAICYFGKMGEVWVCLSKIYTAGRRVYANQQAAMWKRMEQDCKEAYCQIGIKSLRCREGSSDTLAGRVIEFRRKELKALVSS
jgi:hypothetical protein